MNTAESESGFSERVHERLRKNNRRYKQNIKNAQKKGNNKNKYEISDLG